MAISRVVHDIAPVYDENSRVLILGSMPSPKSRETGFYYGHPQNSFWRVLAAVLSEDVPQTAGEKTALLKKRGIALWDVLKSCDISGASDASIKNMSVNDFTPIFSEAAIQAVFTTGKAAHKYYMKYCFEKTGMEAVYLPSTSAANRANYTFDALVSEYRAILDHLL